MTWVVRVKLPSSFPFLVYFLDFNWGFSFLSSFIMDLAFPPLSYEEDFFPFPTPLPPPQRPREESSLILYPLPKG